MKALLGRRAGGARRADVVRVALPPLTVDRVPAAFPELRFTRRLVIATALFDC